MRYDDRNLRVLFARLAPTNRKKVIKGACRKVGNTVKRVAIRNLRASGLNHAEELSSGVRTVVFKREAGFRVTVASKRGQRFTGKGEKGMHRNRYGNKKPVLAWAELGTKWRRTKQKKNQKLRIKGRWLTVTSQHRGFMKRYGFIAKTRTQVDNQVGRQVKEEIANKVIQIAKKYGCS